jgi:integrase
MERAKGSVTYHGRTWWVRFRVNGRRVNVNTGLTDPGDRAGAESRLEAERAKALLRIGPDPGSKVRFEDLCALLESHYRDQGNRSWSRAKGAIDRLGEHFAGRLVSDITSARLVHYSATRQEAKTTPRGVVPGVSRGTVRVELAVLRSAYRLAVAHKLVSLADVPTFPAIRAGEPRTGIFEPKDFARVLSHLPALMRDVATFAYHTGWRRDECRGLRWPDVDLSRQVIRLEVGRSKNKKARALPYGQSPALVSLLKDRDKARKAAMTASPWVFCDEAGDPVGDWLFRSSWAIACKAANVPGRKFHDLRRTCATNLVRAGVSESVTMRICGWSTRAMLDRYNITRDEDVADGLGRLGHNSATNGTRVAEVEPGEDSQAAEG